MEEGIFFMGGLFMNKKFLFVGMAAILGASLVFFACDQGGGSGSDGVPGAAGYLVIDGGGLTFGNTMWDQLFAGNDTVRIIGTFGSIEGTIPENKTLEVAGTGPIGGSDVATLTIKGSVQILEMGAIEDNTGTGGSNIVLVEGGELFVNGSVFAAQGLFKEDNTGIAVGVHFGATGAMDLGTTGNATMVNELFGKGLARIKRVLQTC
jgi:hypothetical protein